MFLPTLILKGDRVRTTRHILSLTALTAVLAMALPACSSDETPPAVAFPDSLSDDELIATVNSEQVTGRDLRVFTLVYQPNLADSLHSGGGCERNHLGHYRGLRWYG